MPDIINPIIKRQIGEQVRPMAETARNLLVQAQAARPALAATLAEIAAADDADILQDDRLAEGVPPLTVGQFRACAGVLDDLVNQIHQDPRLAAILAACVRPARVVSG